MGVERRGKKWRDREGEENGEEREGRHRWKGREKIE